MFNIRIFEYIRVTLTQTYLQHQHNLIWLRIIFALHHPPNPSAQSAQTEQSQQGQSDKRNTTLQ